MLAKKLKTSFLKIKFTAVISNRRDFEARLF